MGNTPSLELPSTFNKNSEGFCLQKLTGQPEAPDRATSQWHLWKVVVAEWSAALEEERLGDVDVGNGGAGSIFLSLPMTPME